MKLSILSRPLLAALCGLSIAAVPGTGQAQDRARGEDRAPDAPRPPRGEFKPGEARPAETTRREDAPRGERGEARPGGEGQRGQFNPQFNPQELFRDLNEDQRTALRGFFEANQGVMREVGEKSMHLRREISEAAMADKVNEDLIRDKVMEAAKLEAYATITRARAFAQVRDKLPKETVERLRAMVAGMGPRPGMQGGGGRGEAGEFRRPGGDVGADGRKPVPNGELRRPGAREGDQIRKPAGEGDRGPRPDGDRGPRVDGDRGPRPDGDRGPRPDGDRGPRPDGDRGRNPEGGDRKPELPRRPPTDQ